jgi:XTP/dITP diphosphohydrolase
MQASPRSVVLSTRNPHKVREVQRILAPWGIAVQALPESVDLPPEVGETFEDNALPKARAAARALGRAAIADDSGIEAEALGGAPGVRSARYAGEQATDQENLDKLLREAPADSPLRYVCALAFVDPGSADAPLERVFFGYTTGRLAAQPRGSGGFGYDPAFLPDDGPDGLTMSELSDEQKDSISHRGRALESFAHWFAGGAPIPAPGR